MKYKIVIYEIGSTLETTCLAKSLLPFTKHLLKESA